MAREGVMPQRTKRTEYGHTYAWHEELGFWHNTILGQGKSPVQIFPPSGVRTDWWVVVPRSGEFHNLRGEDAEARCFSIAAGFINQHPR